MKKKSAVERLKARLTPLVFESKPKPISKEEFLKMIKEVRKTFKDDPDTTGNSLSA